jgi:hypothetical protein
VPTKPGGPPLLFLDVDGVLLPFRNRSASAVRSVDEGVGLADDGSGNPMLQRLNPADGHHLMALGCQLAWATTWMADANETIAPRLGLPPLPVVEFPEDDSAGRDGLHWKTVSLARWAGGRPFVWLDDEISDVDRRWVESHYPSRALLHRVDPMAGLTDSDLAGVRGWLAEE